MKKINQKSKKRKRPKKGNASSKANRQEKKVTGKDTNISQKNNKRAPIKKYQEKKVDKESKGLGGYLSKAAQFLRESRTELKKVKWPNRKELLASTAVVIILVLIVAFFLGVVDFALIKIIKHVVG